MGRCHCRRYRIMSLKSSLLKPTPHIEEHSILGTKVFLRRLTIAELDEYEHDLQDAQKTGFSSDASKAGAELILKAICDEKGNPIPEDELPTADELVTVHDTPTLLSAMAFVQKYSYGSVEEAKKN
ncbi:phage tail protein [Providencia alcalifaciens]|nr:phage tail protein [Providencia alcalifaciens]MTC98970.1 phage tail protein [Providencia alcalifaciens]MTC98979.1 phage tail protein [Providencia alcalifaciens]MTC98984.1 phage tail protein [Providencia alcalifaciens]